MSDRQPGDLQVERTARAMMAAVARVASAQFGAMSKTDQVHRWASVVGMVAALRVMEKDIMATAQSASLEAVMRGADPTVGQKLLDDAIHAAQLACTDLLGQVPTPWRR